MIKFSCLIVDDEPAAHFVLQNYIERIDKLDLAGSCYNVTDAINFLHQQPVDLIFLDINMPELTGFDLLRTLRHPPKVILTTAYSEFALESYEYGALDYLLKPIAFSRFLKSIDRFVETQPQEKVEQVNSITSENTFLHLKVDSGIIKINLDDILYTQSMGNYVKVFTSSQSYLATITTIELEKRLPSPRFVRVHKSYIVAVDKIEKYNSQTITIADAQLPVGITYRRELAEILK